MSHSACSAAWHRGASSSWSVSRNATRPHRAGRVGRDAVEHRLGPHEHVGRRDRRRWPRPPRRSWRAATTRRDRRGAWRSRAGPPSCGSRGSAGRPWAGLVEQRGHESRPSSVSMTAALQTSQRTSSPQATHASSRARPFRFSTHTARPVVEGAAQGIAERDGEQAHPRRFLPSVDDLDHAASRRVRRDATAGAPRRPRRAPRSSGPA